MKKLVLGLGLGVVAVAVTFVSGFKLGFLTKKYNLDTRYGDGSLDGLMEKGKLAAAIRDGVAEQDIQESEESSTKEGGGDYAKTDSTV